MALNYSVTDPSYPSYTLRPERLGQLDPIRASFPGSMGAGNYPGSAQGRLNPADMPKYGGVNALQTNGMGLATWGGAPISTAPSIASNVKSPLFQNAIESGVTALNSGNFNPAVNPNIVRTNTKNPAIQGAINGMLQQGGSFANPSDVVKSGQFQGAINQGYSQAEIDKASNRDQFNQFNNLFTSQTPGVTANVNQENDALNQWYNGGVANQLQSNADAWKANNQQLVNRALGQVGRNASLYGMVNGQGSYGAQQAYNAAGNIAAQQAQAQSELERNNLLTVLGGQGQYMGARDRNLDYLTNRQLQPMDVRNSLANSELARTNQLGAMDLSNNIYTTPYEQSNQRAAILSTLSNLSNQNNFYTLDSAQQNQGRQLALLNQLQGMNNQNNFYGLRQPDPGSNQFRAPSLYVNSPVNPGQNPNNSLVPSSTVQPDFSRGSNALIDNGNGSVSGVGNADTPYPPSWGGGRMYNPVTEQWSGGNSLTANSGYRSAGSQSNSYYDPNTGLYFDRNTGAITGQSDQSIL